MRNKLSASGPAATPTGRSQSPHGIRGRPIRLSGHSPTSLPTRIWIRCACAPIEHPLACLQGTNYDARHPKRNKCCTPVPNRPIPATRSPVHRCQGRPCNLSRIPRDTRGRPKSRVAHSPRSDRTHKESRSVDASTARHHSRLLDTSCDSRHQRHKRCYRPGLEPHTPVYRARDTPHCQR